MQSSHDASVKSHMAGPGWMEALAIVVLFATLLGLGGFVWWPFFVGAVLLACLVYWYYYHGKEVR